MTTAIVKPAVQQPEVFAFTPEQQRMIRESFLSGASESEAAVLMELARIRRLNPITRQIHFVKRWDGQQRREVWSAQVGIDGFRAIAERTGKYDGQDEPEYEYDAKGGLKLCRVKVYRKDWGRPAVGVAHFSEYATTKKEGGLTAMWAGKPHIMLAKCAEALAFRKAFPEDTSGLYAPEEMPDEREVHPVSPPQVTVQAAPPPNVQPATAPASAPLTGSARVKAALAARKSQVIDVAPGETDEQAEARAKATPAPAPMKPWDRILELAQRKHGMTRAQTGRRVKSITGKSKPSELTLEDVVKVEAALDVIGNVQPPESDEVPFPTDEDAPPGGAA